MKLVKERPRDINRECEEDIAALEEWYLDWQRTIKENAINLCDTWNFDESPIRLG